MAYSKKLRDISADLAKEHGVSEDDVINLITCFYEDCVKKEMENFNNAYLQIEHFGVFSIRKNKFDKVLLDMDRIKSFYESQIEKEKTREKKTFDKIVEIWHTNVEKVAELKLRILELKFKIQELDALKKEEHKIKIQQYNEQSLGK